MELRGGGLDAIKEIFPDGVANEMNFVLFSTSGISGSYRTIEEIEYSLEKYAGIEFGNDDPPDDYVYPELTFVMVQPRIIGIRYGNVDVTTENIPYLKKLRQSSWDAIAKIGA